MKVSELLDKKGVVSSPELVSNMLKSALLSLEIQGNIEFQIETTSQEGQDNSLLVKPVNIARNFPKNTLEYRLNPIGPKTVKTIVSQWLVDESMDPWTRAIEQGNIMLVLRKLAIVKSINGRKYKYSKLGLDQKDMNSSKIEDVKKILSNCEQQRPDIWELLDKEIALAFYNMTISFKHNKQYEEKDPWLNESEEDQNLFFQSTNQYQPQKYSYILSLIIGIGFGFLWYFVIQEFSANEIIVKNQDNLAYSIAIIFVLVSILYRLKFKPLVLFSSYTENLFSKKFTKYLIKDQTNFQYFCSSIAGITVFGFLLHLLILKIQESPMILIVIIAIIGYFLYKDFQKKTRKAINRSVMGAAIETPEAKTQVEEWTLESKRELEEDDETNFQKSIQIEIIKAGEIPDSSEESKKRLESISLRGPSYFKIVRKILLYFCLSIFTIASIYWLFFGTNSPFKSTNKFELTTVATGFLIFFLLTLALINPKSSAWIKGFVVNIFISFGAKLIGAQVRSDIVSVKTDESKLMRPIELIALFWVWLILSIYIVNSRYAELSGSKIVSYVLVFSSILIIVGFLFWLRKSRSKLEKQFPYHPPINMLVLRVFGSPYLSNFLALTNSWKWFGTTQRLDGPSTAGYRESDVFNYLIGRVDKSIIENDSELSLALRNFKTICDNKLKFPLNSMQCNNDTWKDALQHLLDKADLIVMDLSNLSPENRGVIYEIQKLFDQFNKERIIFLINDSTDMKVLEKIINQAWNNKSKSSPNSNDNEAKITFYHTGVIPVINKSESVYDWQKRFDTQIDGDHLVRLLFDKSQPSIKSRSLPDIKKEKRAIHWTAIPLPSWLKLIVKGVIAIYFVIEIVLILFKLT